MTGKDPAEGGEMVREMACERRDAALARAREQELAVRREWAYRIKQEFDKYHDHSNGGECGACGAIAGANWMNPDFTKDGPTQSSLWAAGTPS
jgi:hypothetical protein